MKTPNILITLMMTAACVGSYAGSDAIYVPSDKSLTTLNEMKGLLKAKIKAGEKPSGFIKSGRFYYNADITRSATLFYDSKAGDLFWLQAACSGDYPTKFRIQEINEKESMHWAAPEDGSVAMEVSRHICMNN